MKILNDTESQLDIMLAAIIVVGIVAYLAFYHNR